MSGMKHFHLSKNLQIFFKRLTGTEWDILVFDTDN